MGERIFIICVLLYPALHFSIFYIGLNTRSLMYAFQSYDSAGQLYFSGFKNFITAWNLITTDTSMLYVGIINSVSLFVLTTAIGMPLNMLFGYYLFKKRFGHKAIRFIAMLPSIVSGLVVTLLFLRFVEGPLPDILRMLKISEKTILFLRDPRFSFGTVVVYSLWTGFGGMLIYYPNAMNAIDGQLFESAKIDGATELQQIWHIILPLVYPTITTFMVTGIAGLLGTAGPLFAFFGYDAPSEIYFSGYYIFRLTMQGSESSYPVLAAIGFIFTLISAPLTLLVKWAMENFGPSENDGKYFKRRAS